MQLPKGLRLWSSAPELRGHQQIKYPWALGGPRRLVGALTQPRCEASTGEAQDNTVALRGRCPLCLAAWSPRFPWHPRPWEGQLAERRPVAAGWPVPQPVQWWVGGGLQQSPVSPRRPDWQICNGAGCGGGRVVPAPPSAQQPRPQTRPAQLLAGPAQDLERSWPRVCPARAPGQVTGSAQSQNSRPRSWRLGPVSALLSCPRAPRPPA